MESGNKVRRLWDMAAEIAFPIGSKPEKAGIKAEEMKSNMVVDDFNIDEIWPVPLPPPPVQIKLNVACN